MGVDVRQAKNREYPRRCKLYKSKYVVNSALVDSPECEGVFYCKDVISYKQSANVEFGVANTKSQTITIETLDYVSTMEVNDFVLYEGRLWRVMSFVSNDDGMSKQYSSRPITKTTIELKA